MAEKPDFTPCHVAYCGTCGLIDAVTIVEPRTREYAAKDVAQWIRAGRRVGTMTVTGMRGLELCKCHRKAVSDAR